MTKLEVLLSALAGSGWFFALLLSWASVRFKRSADKYIVALLQHIANLERRGRRRSAGSS